LDDIQAEQNFLGLKMKRILYILLLLIVFLGAFELHIIFLPQAKEFLVKSYFINALMALIALALLTYGIKNKKSNLALIYILTIALKLIVYFFFFYPQFKSDGVIIRKEFFTFFIPYSLGLLAEITLLVNRFK